MLGPCTNGLLVESKVQTLYDRNTRRRTIKVYGGIATLAFACEPSTKAKKCKNDVTDTPGIEPTTYLGGEQRTRRVHCTNRLKYGMAVYIQP